MHLNSKSFSFSIEEKMALSQQITQSEQCKSQAKIANRQLAL